jgi:hypothetical protein
MSERPIDPTKYTYIEDSLDRSISGFLGLLGGTYHRMQDALIFIRDGSNLAAAKLIEDLHLQPGQPIPESIQTKIASISSFNDKIRRELEEGEFVSSMRDCIIAQFAYAQLMDTTDDFHNLSEIAEEIGGVLRPGFDSASSSDGSEETIEGISNGSIDNIRVIVDRLTAHMKSVFIIVFDISLHRFFPPVGPDAPKRITIEDFPHTYMVDD